MRVIPRSALLDVLDEPSALAATERGFIALARGEAIQPPPWGLEIPEAAGEIHVKGAYLRGSRIAAIKVATGFFRNRELGLPSSSGMFIVLNAVTGAPEGVLEDGGYLTRMRTGAAGALATRVLAPVRIGSIGLIGCGSQGRHQIRAIAGVRSFGEVRVWSPDPEEVEAYVAEMEGVGGGRYLPAPDVEAAVRGADLIVTVTPSRAPLVRPEWLEAHATVLAVGSDGPDKQELDVGVLSSADKIVVDRLEQCLRLGELHHAVDAGVVGPGDVYAELGEVLAGLKPGRERDERIVCDLTGVGAQDAAVAEAAWEALGHSG